MLKSNKTLDNQIIDLIYKKLPIYKLESKNNNIKWEDNLQLTTLTPSSLNYVILEAITYYLSKYNFTSSFIAAIILTDNLLIEYRGNYTAYSKVDNGLGCDLINNVHRIARPFTKGHTLTYSFLKVGDVYLNKLVYLIYNNIIL
jgi:hypothetical protein